MSYRDSMGDRETYQEFRERMQREDPDPTRCEHAVPLRVRCIVCDDIRDRAALYSTSAGRRISDPFDIAPERI